MNRFVWDFAAKLYSRHRKTGKPIDGADLIIAAFCIANSYTLVTDNEKHFSVIDQLNIVNWK